MVWPAGFIPSGPRAFWQVEVRKSRDGKETVDLDLICSIPVPIRAGAWSGLMIALD